jgi:hypothetical protein
MVHRGVAGGERHAVSCSWWRILSAAIWCRVVASFAALQGVPTGGCERDDWDATLQRGWKRGLFCPTVRHIIPAHNLTSLSRAVMYQEYLVQWADYPLDLDWTWEPQKHIGPAGEAMLPDLEKKLGDTNRIAEAVTFSIHVGSMTKNYTFIPFF